MAYQDPKVDWTENYEPSPEDMNRIEGNIQHIKSQNTDFDGVKTFNNGIIVSGLTDIDSLAASGTALFDGEVICDKINTGQGYNEVYPMNQAVRTTDTVNFLNIVAQGTVTSSGLSSTGNIVATDDLLCDNVILRGDATADGNIEALGSVTAGTSVEATYLNSTQGRSPAVTLTSPDVTEDEVYIAFSAAVPVGSTRFVSGACFNASSYRTYIYSHVTHTVSGTLRFYGIRVYVNIGLPPLSGYSEARSGNGTPFGTFVSTDSPSDNVVSLAL